QQFGMRGKPFVHFGCWPEIVMAAQPFFRMLLAQECQSADALDDIVFPAVGRKLVMNRQGSDAWQGRVPFCKRSAVVNLEIKPVREKLSQFGVGTYRQEITGVVVEEDFSRVMSRRN